MSACEFVGSNVDFYVPLVLKRADLFLAADLFLECLVLECNATLRWLAVCTTVLEFIYGRYGTFFLNTYAESSVIYHVSSMMSPRF